jgi:hypothetical protein
MISPLKLIGWVFGALLLVGGIFWWNRRQDTNNAAEVAVWKKKYADDTLAAKAAKDSAYQAGLANAQSIPVYIHDRATITGKAANTPAASLVKACFESADARISACEKSRKADSVVIAKKDSVINDLKNKPTPQEKRFQFYGAAGYSARTDSAGTQMAPAFRVGLDSKLVGSVRLMTDAQLSLPGKGHAQSMWQANVMGRVNF